MFGWFIEAERIMIFVGFIEASLEREIEGNVAGSKETAGATWRRGGREREEEGGTPRGSTTGVHFERQHAGIETVVSSSHGCSYFDRDKST